MKKSEIRGIILCEIDEWESVIVFNELLGYNLDMGRVETAIQALEMLAEELGIDLY